MKNYEFLFTQFQEGFGEMIIDSITPDEILSFLTRITDGTKQTTKRNRYSSLKAFFNYIKNSVDPNIQNPCDTPILRKIFKDRKITLPEPKSGKESEVVFIPQKVADRFKDPASPAHLSTTQRYSGKISDIEALKWIENLYG